MDIFIHNFSDISSNFPFDKLHLNHVNQLFYLQDRDPACLICLAIPNVTFHQVSVRSRTNPQLNEVNICFQDDHVLQFFQQLHRRFSISSSSTNLVQFVEKQITVSFAFSSESSGVTTVYCYDSLQQQVSDAFLTQDSFLPVSANILLQLHSCSSSNQYCFFLLQCMMQSNHAKQEDPIVQTELPFESFVLPTQEETSPDFLFPLSDGVPIEMDSSSASTSTQPTEGQVFQLYTSSDNPIEENDPSAPAPALALAPVDEPGVEEFDFFNTASSIELPVFPDLQESVVETNAPETDTPTSVFTLFDEIPILSTEDQEQALSCYAEEAQQLPKYSKEKESYDIDDEEDDEQDVGVGESKVVVQSKYRARRRQWKDHLKTYFNQLSEQEQVPKAFAKAWIPAISYLSSDEDDHSSSDDEDKDPEEVSHFLEKNNEDNDDEDELLVY